MNATYTWSNDEIVVAERMKDMQREAQKAHLIHQADLSEEKVHTHAAAAFGKILISLGQRLNWKHSQTTQACQATTSKHTV